MRNSRNPTPRVTARQLGIGAILTAAAIGAQSGCTREFYREWANQDASEAVFEKSRDPRWRMDIFSIEPPALSRYADPYDQEVPPAPPDDPAAEALSPVPQWPDNRLLLPTEGTGYLDLLEYWRRDQEAKKRAAGLKVPENEPEYWQMPDNGRHPITDPRQPGMPGQPLRSPAGGPVPPETGFTVHWPANPAGVPRRGRGRPAGPRPPVSSVQGPSPRPVKPQVSEPGPGGVTFARCRAGAGSRLQTPASGAGGAGLPPGPRGASTRPSDGVSRDTFDQLVFRLQNDDQNPKKAPIPPPKTFGEKPIVTNPGTNAHDLTPITVTRGATKAVKPKIPPPHRGRNLSNGTTSSTQGAMDPAVSRASYQDNGSPGQPASATGSVMRTEVLPIATVPHQSQPPRPASPRARTARPSQGRRPPASKPARRGAEQHPRQGDRQRARSPSRSKAT